MSKCVALGTTALFACVLCAAPVSFRVSPDGKLSLSLNSATAEIGRPLTATSVAGVHRRQARRAYRRGYYNSNYANGYGYGTGYGTGMYQTYNNYGYRPLLGTEAVLVPGFGVVAWNQGGTGYGWNQPWGGYASTGYYGGYGRAYYNRRRWTEF